MLVPPPNFVSRLRSLPLGGLLCVLAACSPDLPDPVVQEIRPDWGFNGQTTAIEVRGHSFFPRVQLGGGDEAIFDHQFRVVLETDPEVELDDVTVVDYRRIEAVVPAGLPVGSYALRVEGPGGGAGRLDQAFDVRDSLADHLLLTPTDGQLSWMVGEFAGLDVELVDIDGGRVTEDLEVSIRAEGVDGSSLSFQSDALLDQVQLADGTGISGRLGSSGRALVAFTSNEAIDAMVLRVDPLESGSVIDGALQILSFTPGEVAGLRIDLPEGEWQATAGSSFAIDISAIDGAGNVVEGADTQLILTEACGDGTLSDTVRFAGSVKGHSVRLTRATQDDCVANGIVAVGIAGGEAVSVSSDPVQVLPGSAVGLNLQALPRSVVAGVDPIYTFATAVDSWDNRVDFEGSGLTVSVSTDGGGFTAPAWWECSAMTGGEAVCESLLTQAGESVVIWGNTGGPSPLTGFSAPFQVLPGEVTSLDVQIESSPVTAGEPFELRVLALDSLGNGVWLDPEGADSFVATSELDDLVCVWDRHDEDSAAEILSCMLTVAAVDRVIEVELASYGISGGSEPFAVDNGELDQVEMVVGSSSVEAGQSLALSLAASDAWGNPWVVRSSSSIELSDDGGSLSPTEVLVDADGRAAISVVMTTAWMDNRIYASSGASLLGMSDAFDVLPGDPIDLELRVDQPFAWVGTGLDIQLRAVDEYGNTATSYEGLVDLSSTTGSGPDEQVELVQGQGSVSYLWTTGLLGELLLAEDAELETSIELDVLWPDCAGGPVAQVRVDSREVAVLCRLSSGRTRAVTVSTEGSSSGSGGSLVQRYFREGEADWTSAGASYSTSWSALAGFRLQAVVADALACGSSDEALVYIGDPDGQPTGPVTLAADLSELRAGDPGSAGLATVEVGALDCEGDPASSGQLLVWVDRGEILVDGSTVSSSGKGLNVNLDSAGEASIQWSSASTGYGGGGLLHLGREAASAYGGLSLSFTNDSVRPRVLALEPAGSQSGSVEQFELQFSEELLSASLSASLIRILTPAGEIVPLGASDYLLDGDRLFVEPPTPLDMDLGTWQISIDSAVRDLDGNRLDGTWTGVRSTFTRQLGDVADSSPDLLSCEAETSTFRPDGDDGAGEEAEELSLQVVADGPAEWWRLRVLDATGDALRVDWVEASSADTAVLSWDGRDGEGRIVDGGSYRLEVIAADAHWNQGAACELELVVAHRLEAP